MDNMDLNAPHSMGTTIIGVTYNGGVVLGADSRTSTGMYVANRASDKIAQLTDNVYICRSGSAADSQTVVDYVRYFLHQHTIQLGQPATVKVAANLVRLLSYNNKNMLQTGIIVGGWDKYEGGKIYGVPLGGTIIEQPFAIGGSGSSYLYGFFDQAWKEGMTKDEAEQLVFKAVSLAIARDGASGGVVRTVIINADGVTRNFYPGDTLPLWHEELEPQSSLLDILNAPAPEPGDSLPLWHEELEPQNSLLDIPNAPTPEPMNIDIQGEQRKVYCCPHPHCQSSFTREIYWEVHHRSKHSGCTSCSVGNKSADNTPQQDAHLLHDAS